ncbi:kinase-like domain-containing protein [Ochromonadaceae sp. CCMP2298]|nr:kinase-like domain-containing protein [Ochromonadaceae sp. CCMP2298]
MASLGRTSCVDFISSVHGAQRRFQREISKRDLQAAVKYGVKEKAPPHPGSPRGRLKFTYNNIVYITDSTATKEVTSWDTVQLPLEKAEIDDSLSRQIAEQKLCLASSAAAVTSHAVLVVHQSGSMREGDLVGHRSRSRGAYYTIANEMIAQPLLRDQLSFTDVVTVIEMRDGAVVTIDKEPITWELHNKIVDLANEPLRAGRQGNYLPALQKSSKVLHGIEDENCALLLLFLSDGGPSDFCTLFRGKNRHDRARGAIIAEGAGLEAVFACGLDADSLRRALFTMATSLQTTRTNLSSLAGGSLLRVTENKVKRTDLKKDVSGSESGSVLLEDHDFLFTKENGLLRDGLRRAVAKATYDSKMKRESIQWIYVPLQHPEAGGIAVKKGYIGPGAERAAYEMTEVTADRVAVGQPLVGKLSIHEESSQIEFHMSCAVTQYEALHLASFFNDRLDELSRSAETSVPHIEFLPVLFYDWFAADGSMSALLCEKRLDSTRYKKWNDNKGGVISLNKRIVPVPEEVDDEEEEGTFAYEEDPAPGAVSATLSEFASHIIDEDVPQAFSHWTHDRTRGHSLVCDMQGVLGNSSFQLTDPAIHSSSRRYGSTDYGRNGQRNFFKTHVCNPLCRVLHLRPPPAASTSNGAFQHQPSRKVQKV